MDVDQYYEMPVVPAKDVDWSRVAHLQVKTYQVERRMAANTGGPIRWFKLLGTVERYCVEAVHLDHSWDRVAWFSDEEEARRLLWRLAARHQVKWRLA